MNVKYLNFFIFNSFLTILLICKINKSILEQYIDLSENDLNEDLIKAKAKHEEIVSLILYEKKFENHFSEISNEV
jgi:hypothetical protein